jgi:hypothetical protein
MVAAARSDARRASRCRRKTAKRRILPLKRLAQLRELPGNMAGRMIRSECPECDAAVPLLARTCSHCGAPNQARHGVVAVAAGLAVLVIAGVGAAYVARRQPPPVAAQRTPAVTPAVTPAMPSAAAADGDFAWLSSAMTGCDTLASQQPDKLHFLVIPLRANPQDLPDWRLLSVGAIGNGLTIPTDDALGGLKRGTLIIYPDEYVFAMQDATTRVVNKWDPSVGANRFSTPQAQTTQSFRLQLAPRQKADQADWGNVYTRQNGSCHWIAAIMRE